MSLFTVKGSVYHTLDEIMKLPELATSQSNRKTAIRLLRTKGKAHINEICIQHYKAGPIINPLEVNILSKSTPTLTSMSHANPIWQRTDRNDTLTLAYGKFVVCHDDTVPNLLPCCWNELAVYLNKDGHPTSTITPLVKIPTVVRFEGYCCCSIYDGEPDKFTDKTKKTLICDTGSLPYRKKLWEHFDEIVDEYERFKVVNYSDVINRQILEDWRNSAS